MSHSTTTAGYTIIELLATIVVSLLFLLTIVQLNSAITSLSLAGSQSVTADNLAYSNLRTFANGRSPSTWFTCDPANPTDSVVLKNDTTDVEQLPGPVTQYVEAIAPYGCGDTDSGKALKLTSYVEYGSSGKRAIHATYVSF